MIIPIAITSVDWTTYLKKAKELLGFSVSETIDLHKLKQDMSSFLVSLTEWSQESVDPSRAIREAGSLLRHGSASFLCMLPLQLLFQFQQEVDLAINSVETNSSFHLVICSGNFLQWQRSIVNCSSQRVSTEIRSLANKFMGYFESWGLGGIWSIYSKISMNDNTVRLLLK